MYSVLLLVFQQEKLSDASHTKYEILNIGGVAISLQIAVNHKHCGSLRDAFSSNNIIQSPIISLSLSVRRLD